MKEAFGSIHPDCDHPVTETDSRGRRYCGKCGADLQAERWSP
ncbi:hypothetical protein [Halorarius halobius]|nr:hypothetical protein [Halorarius halobius]